MDTCRESRKPVRLTSSGGVEFVPRNTSNGEAFSLVRQEREAMERTIEARSEEGIPRRQGRNGSVDTGTAVSHGTGLHPTGSKQIQWCRSSRLGPYQTWFVEQITRRINYTSHFISLPVWDIRNCSAHYSIRIYHSDKLILYTNAVFFFFVLDEKIRKGGFNGIE